MSHVTSKIRPHSIINNTLIYVCRNCYDVNIIRDKNHHKEPNYLVKNLWSVQLSIVKNYERF